jgi:hypothetical protein
MDGTEEGLAQGTQRTQRKFQIVIAGPFASLAGLARNSSGRTTINVALTRPFFDPIQLFHSDYSARHASTTGPTCPVYFCYFGYFCYKSSKVTKVTKVAKVTKVTNL